MSNKTVNRSLPSIIYKILLGLFFIGGLLYGLHYVNNTLRDPQFTQLVQWFGILIIMNIIITVFIIFSYSNIKIRRGIKGPRGHTGLKGQQGIAESCKICDKEIPIMEQKYDDIVIQTPTLKDNINIEPRGFISLPELGPTISKDDNIDRSKKANFWKYIGGKGKPLSLGLGNHNYIGDKMNDKISSISVPKGYQIIVYKHYNFKGLSETYTSGYYADIRKTGRLRDQISSVKVEIAGGGMGFL